MSDERAGTVDRAGGRDGRASADDASRYLALYRRMLLIREFEERVQALFLRGMVHGTTHLYSGQEAVAVGVTATLWDADRVAGTYRGHGHALALGLEPVKLMEELLGRGGGVCRGRAGSMNVVDLEHGLIGCFGIVGGSIAAATGSAFALKRRGAVAVAFFGDGAINQAYFYECLNFAKVFSLPAVFVCENNLYGEYTPSARVTAGSVLARAEAMELPARAVDGNDLWAVESAASEAVERARRGDGPTLIEAATYRFVGHSRSDPGTYRPEGELDEWRARDPLIRARDRLESDYAVPGGRLDRLVEEVREEIDRVEAEAVEDPFPDPAEDRGSECKAA